MRQIVNREKDSGKIAEGYFTVEAALVLPVVFACIFSTVVFLCYEYERCLLEQNACRLPVWKVYVEGYLDLYPETDGEYTKEDICGYIMDKLNREEQERYIFAETMQAGIKIRGTGITVERSYLYPYIRRIQQGFTVTGNVADPVRYLRNMKWMDKLVNKEDEEKE